MTRVALRRGGAAALVWAVAAGCFSERSAVTPPSGAELCEGARDASVVRIRDFEFEPAELRVARGATVRWVNCGTDSHTSTADGGAWRSGLLGRHATYSHRFDDAGRASYHCEPHPFMTASVVVE